MRADGCPLACLLPTRLLSHLLVALGLGAVGQLLATADKLEVRHTKAFDRHAFFRRAEGHLFIDAVVLLTDMSEVLQVIEELTTALVLDLMLDRRLLLSVV